MILLYDPGMLYSYTCTEYIGEHGNYVYFFYIDFLNTTGDRARQS
jgi:hypothetical protein